MESMTKSEAKRLTGAKNDSELARMLGVCRQAVSLWGGDDGPIPQQRVWQIKAMMAERKSA